MKNGKSMVEIWYGLSPKMVNFMVVYHLKW